MDMQKNIRADSQESLSVVGLLISIAQDGLGLVLLDSQKSVLSLQMWMQMAITTGMQDLIPAKPPGCTNRESTPQCRNLLC